MLSKKQQKILMVLDVIELILCFGSVLVLTLMFRLVDNNLRYLFLLGVVVILFEFSYILSHMETKVQPRIIKNSNHKIEASFIRKISL